MSKTLEWVSRQSPENMPALVVRRVHSLAATNNFVCVQPQTVPQKDIDTTEEQTSVRFFTVSLKGEKLM